MPRFTLIVSSTDRPNLLRPAIKGVLASEFDDFEVIVSDNFSKIPARRLLAGIEDARIRYLRTEARLSISDHWHFIWQHVTGDYVMLLGDDNALRPDMLGSVDRILKQYQFNALCWRVASYYHPDWDIDYWPHPSHGNVVGIDPGHTGRLYRCNARAVLQDFAATLQMSGCVPSMQNSVFKREHAESIRRKAGQIFWAPCPDLASTVLILATTGANGFGFWDFVGGLGGRSRDSNLASVLSRGTRSNRFREFMTEYGGPEAVFPHHTPKFWTISNVLAAPFSIGRHFFPEEFADLVVPPEMLARRAIEDIYLHCTVPWDNDSDFLAEFEAYLDSLPPLISAEMKTYRDERKAQRAQREKDRTPRMPSGAADTYSPDTLADSWKLFWQTGHYPFRRVRHAAGQIYVDMRLFGGRDIVRAAKILSKALKMFDRFDSLYAVNLRNRGLVGEELPVPAA